ncbi:arylesterase [Mucilaginibacter psychrotolerans]|uniref:Arylesterase n=1 Tax=Mucilaginibacter psychrotolerans TaxID=1524096 RepID=A0A4Y8S7D3_9SPHI|nr:arylesterase [Mucilaginibacter psychrotolerans]TFF34656.1 arylesterase [Mucilaginibacter psychrotolerans]
MKYPFKITSVLLLTALLTACGGDKKPAAGSDTTSTSTTSKGAEKKIVLFFGDSLTAGYGLEDASQAFPGVVQAKIDSAKLPYTVVNGGQSGETSAGGLSRIDWLLKQQPLDVFVLELGANDGLRGLPVDATTQNLQAIIDKVKAKYPKAKLVITGMQVPPNMGADYANNFKNIFPTLATKNAMVLVPFLLQDVAGIRKLNQGDGIHPTAEGAKIVGANVWAELKDIL